jgi:hypothetical protein
MTDDSQGDGYTLGLLVDLRDLCTKFGDNHSRLHRTVHPDPSVKTSPMDSRDQHDGYRLIASTGAAGCGCSRRGYDWTERYPLRGTGIV